MSSTSFRLFFRRSDFVVMIPAQANLALLRTIIDALGLSTPVYELRQLPDGGVAIELATLPTPAEVALITAAVAAFVGGSTTNRPITVESLGTTQSTVGTLTKKAELPSPPLDGGTYTFAWCSTLKMNPAAVNSGVQGLVRLTRSDGVIREQTDSWDLTAPHAHNGSLIFDVTAGQSLLAEVFVARLGSAGVAEMSGVRLTIYQLAPDLT